MNSSSDFVGNVEDVGVALKAMATVITGGGAVFKAIQGLLVRNRKLSDAVAAQGSRGVDSGGGDTAKSISDAGVVSDARQGEAVAVEGRLEVNEGMSASLDGVDSGRVPQESETEGAVMFGDEERDVSGNGGGGGGTDDIRAQVAELAAVQGAILEQLARLAEAVSTIGQATTTVGQATSKAADAAQKNSASIQNLSKAVIAHTAQIARLTGEAHADGH